MTPILTPSFFAVEPIDLAVNLLGKVLRHRVVDARHGSLWLSSRIIETEAYYRNEKGSHSSLGFTEKRKAMFMAPGTLYMYYARGKDSLNFSALGDGNGVLVKSGYAHVDRISPRETLEVMHKLNPGKSDTNLCSGQTLLCRSLNLTVNEWNQQSLNRKRIRLDDIGYRPARVVKCRRLGIPSGRDDHLKYRFVDAQYAGYCTSNPLTKRSWREGVDFEVMGPN